MAKKGNRKFGELDALVKKHDIDYDDNDESQNFFKDDNVEVINTIRINTFSYILRNSKLLRQMLNQRFILKNFHLVNYLVVKPIILNNSRLELNVLNNMILSEDIEEITRILRIQVNKKECYHCNMGYYPSDIIYFNGVVIICQNCYLNIYEEQEESF